MSESVENTAIVKEGEDSEQGAALNMDDSQIDQDEDALTPSIANNDDDNDLNGIYFVNRPYPKVNLTLLFIRILS